MANEEGVWLQKHAHESQRIVYGTIGTAIYHQVSGRWMFLKDEKQLVDVDHNQQDIDEDLPSLFTLLSLPETEIEASAGLHRKHGLNSVVASAALERAVARPLLRHVQSQQAASPDNTTTGKRIVLGNAAWLNADNIDSGNLTVPIVVFVTGLTCNNLQFVCTGRRRSDIMHEHFVAKNCQIPSLAGEPRTEWSTFEPVEQLVFSARTTAGVGSTFLAVRQGTRTCVFEPLLHRGVSEPSQVANHFLDPNHLLHLDISVTGGQKHADVAFNPADQRQLAVIDVQGNWSTWMIHGKRTHSARILYQAQLKSSGKVFTWENQRRPNGTELYYDGWHRILWVSSTNRNSHQILICNRQSAKLCSLDGHEVYSVDIRLDTRKVDAYILDAQSGPRPDLFFILTTFRLLLFSMAATDWKYSNGQQGYSLICSWQHFYHPNDLTLKIAQTKFNGSFVCCLHSARSTTLKLFQCKQAVGRDDIPIMSTQLYPLHLPAASFINPIASVTLATTQIEELENRQSHVPFLLRVIVQQVDLSVVAATVAMRLPSEMMQSDSRNYDLRFPPTRNMRIKSEKFVDDSESGDYQASFVLRDADFQSNKNPPPEWTQSSSLQEGNKQLQSPKYLSQVLHRVKERIDPGLAARHYEATNIHRFIEQASHTLKTLSILSGAFLIAELVSKSSTIEDVEAESAVLQQSIATLRRDLHERFEIREADESFTLSHLYNSMFVQYIDSLPSGIPDRTRLYLERIVRQTALDICYSNLVIQTISFPSTEVAESQQPMGSDTMIFSDPIPEENELRNQIIPFSASQPQRHMVSRTNGEHAFLISSMPKTPPMSSVLERLARLTTVSNPPPQGTLEDDSASHHIMSLLAHLPIGVDQSPNDYDWQAAELAFAVEKTEQTNVPKSQAQRRAEKLGKAKKRAEAEAGSRWESEAALSANISNQTLGRLPVRSHIAIASTYLGNSKKEANQGTVTGTGLMAERNTTPQSQAIERLALSQPEKGVFGSRVGTGRESRQKKKKRVAGF